MKFYLAPMEGVTGYIFRNAQHEFFPNIDKYFTPFIAANQTGKLKSKEKKDILPENNQGLNIVPQILTNNADDFVRTANDLKNYGYEEINLNLGCPSGTVVSKCKGSGFLAHLERLEQFLDEIFERCDSRISIKTRIGIEDGEEFCRILELYNKYSMEELIIHPRVLKDYYKNTPHLDIFAEALRVSKNKIVYNGDIFTAADYENFHEQFPEVDTIMLGRGLIGNPGLVASIKEGYQIDAKTMKAFHDRIIRDYSETLSGDINILYKMKEFWFYMGPMFADAEKERKKIRKCNHLEEYHVITANLFRERTIPDGAGFLPII